MLFNYDASEDEYENGDQDEFDHILDNSFDDQHNFDTTFYRFLILDS